MNPQSDNRHNTPPNNHSNSQNSTPVHAGSHSRVQHLRIMKFLLRKEFRQIFRDKSILPVIFIMPMIQLLIMPLAADFEVKHINLAVVDNDHSSYTQRLLSKLGSSGYFHLTPYNASYPQALHRIEDGSADIILEIPPHFERNLIREGSQKVLISADAINGMKGTLGSSYLSSVLTDFNNDIRMEWSQPASSASQPASPPSRLAITVTPLNWYNPQLNYQRYMVPGILVILVTMVGGFIAALNIVREKELGTIEQINVSPVKKWQFITCKLIPFWLIGMFDFTAGLLIARLVYGIIPAGSLLVLYSFLAVYLIAVLGMGLLISTYSDNQLQAMFVAFFFIMIFILMSGQFTPLDNMPEWAKWISRLTPVTYFVEVNRMVVLKGSGFGDIRYQLLVELGFAVVLNGWAILNYKKTS